MSAHGQELMYGKDRMVVTALAPTRYDLAAAGFGAATPSMLRISTDLVPALRRALEGKRPACVNVMTDPSVIAPITQMMVASAAPRPDDDAVRMPYYGERKA